MAGENKGQLPLFTPWGMGVLGSMNG